VAGGRLLARRRRAPDARAARGHDDVGGGPHPPVEGLSLELRRRPRPGTRAAAGASGAVRGPRRPRPARARHRDRAAARLAERGEHGSAAPDAGDGPPERRARAGRESPGERAAR
jgi:hypothetical protein